MIDTLLEKNLLPDFAVRMGIRKLLGERLREESGYDESAYVANLKNRGIAEQTATANEQHYEVPTEFYLKCLGPRLKYSGCYYESGNETLEQAETAMLDLYAERGEFTDGQDILELGCGWGSITLYLAAKYPNSKITAVSNSRTQKEHIDAQAVTRGLNNVTVITADMNDFDITASSFDRVISIEMFEHMKNYQSLLANVARWLRSGGKLFVHIFTHQKFSYHFVVRDQSDWMSRYFFTGGQMPSHQLLAAFQDDLKLEQDWKINGRHYQQTAEHWLENMDQHRAEIEPLLVATYGADQTKKWWVYWRVFYMSCAELWGYRNGEEWLVSHYRFVKP
ncbi:MAG: SAM-dependent methyltransferase [Verrucomicrobiia bacterium]|tara:strand:- start:717 stop:1724 length:1008 start_codon:yes stop_codon:yes gene_type:complete